MFEFPLRLCLLTLRVFGLFCKALRQHILVWTTRQPHANAFQREPPKLSKSLDQLRASYDVIVIGSGYGAGVAASRMARATPKQSVCVLERGLERWPGQYPDSLKEAICNLKFTGYIKTFLGNVALNLGSKTGLYHWIVGNSSSVFVGNGLGGTSLLNAGVLLRSTSDVLKCKEWPHEVRQDGSLDEYFRRAESMLEPRKYPKTFPSLRKYDVLRQQAKAVSLEKHFSPAHLMTAFTTCETAAGVKLQPSTLSSQDSMGLNDGSKNTVVTSYLADAWNWGAEIYCGCEVRYLTKHPSQGYNIYYRDLTKSSVPNATISWVHAKKLVFLGAGSLGTTEIVLRSKEHGLGVSSQVGQRMSGNGSMLAFGYNLSERVNSCGRNLPLFDPPGPTISGMIDCRQSGAVDEGFLIQDGAFPTVIINFFRIIRWLLPSYPSSSRSWYKTCTGTLLDSWYGRDALDHTQVYLTLGHDSAVGNMSLKQDIPYLDMTGVASSKQLWKVQRILKQMTHAFGGTFLEDGIKACVHPLGGMSMSSDGQGRNGATKHTGEVFSSDGDAVHAGLLVTDGALIPRSLGSNPVATITALSERVLDLVASRAGMTIDLETKKSFDIEYSKHIEHTADDIVFFETMAGTALLDGEKYPLMLEMHIVMKKLGNTYKGDVSGNARCPALSTGPLKIQSGTFMPFQRSSRTSMTWIMLYDLVLISSLGEMMYLKGVKTINPSIAFSPVRAWQATTNMAVTVRSADGCQIGTAAIRIGATDFVRQLRSFRARPQALFDFLGMFATYVAKFMLVPLAPLQYPEDYKYESNTIISTKAGPTSIEIITASDGFKVPLRMWKPTGQPNGRDLLFIPGGAVTHEIFALPTIRRNAIEHFTALGYRCWCVTPRAATIDRSVRQKLWTAFDARLDVEAALKTVYAHRNNGPVLVIAHCVGTVALASGLLDGTIRPGLISGIVASQTFLTPLYAPMNELKARLGLVRFYRWVAGDWYDCHSSPSDALIQRAINLVLRFYPQSSRAELCDSSVCQRTQLPYGRLWDHANLNEATHSRLHKVFSGTSADGIEHLADMGLKGVITDKQGKSLVTDDNLEKLRDIPIFLLSGGTSQVFRTEATLRTQQLLNNKFGAEAARRKVFAGLGHLDTWMSEVAAEPGSVFETVADELEIMPKRAHKSDVEAT